MKNILIGLCLALFVGSPVFGQTKFKVRVENIADAEGLVTTGEVRYPFALSPGMFVVSKKKMDFFKTGKKASAGLEAQAEDGDPEILSKSLAARVGLLNMGVFNTPVGAAEPAPILPGGVFEFEFTAVRGMKLNFITMFGQSNDLFYAPEKAIDLFVGGAPISGDITDRLMLWDAGTEINQAPGVGDEQAPRQKMRNTGMAENGRIGPVKDGFMYPKTSDVLRVTITSE